ncbi:ABC transporter substrate-binding protein [Aquamicrobium segne]|uniref:ABC transporter substrate-binding protein n=1 Tax=Aquamicrobium segne TaxID=469547 RepID=A0ABW0GZ89_9HYPH
MAVTAAPASPVLSRRCVMAGIGAGLALPALSWLSQSVQAAQLDELVLYGPPAGPSIVLAGAVASGALTPFAGKADFKVWRNPDEMRAGLTSGTMGALVLPVQVAANLYNRGMKLKLLNIMTKGLLYIVSDDTGIDSLPALKGRKLAVPFRNDMPDLVLLRLLAHYGMTPGTDIVIENAGSPIEAMQMLIAGRVDAVLAPEPACTAAIIMGKLAGKDMRRVIDVQTVWGEVTGKEPVLPQAGLALTDALVAAAPELANGLQAVLEEAAARVNADPENAAKIAAPSLDFPEPVLAASIATSKLVAERAGQARPAIEAMLSMLADSDPAIIGGHLPDDGFYL